MMKRSKFRIFIYWCILIAIVSAVSETTGYVVMLRESKIGIDNNGNIDSSYDFLNNSNYFHVRGMLMGDTTPAQLPRYLAQPYMAYIAYPRFAKYGQQEHNEDGYRGKRLPLERDGKFRILCMGGSTTYGNGVRRWQQSYPAQLDSLLNVYCSKVPGFLNQYKGVEVLNAGVEAGTSAEELSQYIFKYHYYKPDMVILQTGGNDALINTDDHNYQPDYTHYRRMDFNLAPLPPRSRWLLKSYFCSYVIIRLFFSSVAEHPFYKFEKDGSTAYCRWNHLNVDSLIKAGDYDYYAFNHNFNALMRELKSDSVRVLLMPFVLNPSSEMVKGNPMYRENVKLTTGMIESVASASGFDFLNFTSDSVSYEKYAIDDCHLNATGEHLKAEVILRKVTNIIK